MPNADAAKRKLPSVDEVMRAPAAGDVVGRYGRAATVDAVRTTIAQARAERTALSAADAVAGALARLEASAQPNLRPVFNLTGTVLHTNLGRALIAEEAVEAAVAAMRNAVALEFDLGGGRRGERDDHLRGLLCELTGAEDATVVNNNAAAVLIVLNTLAHGPRGDRLARRADRDRRRVPHARHHGARRREAGRGRHHQPHAPEGLHRRDQRAHRAGAQGAHLQLPHRGLHQGSLAARARGARARAQRAAGQRSRLRHARRSRALRPRARADVAEAIADGADLVTFSGDKLLGGPQAGFIVGRKELIARINKNPMKRALRVDKMRLAALEATLRLYRDPDRLAERLPTMRLLARQKEDIAALAQRLAPPIASALGGAFTVEQIDCASQIGSGALPVETVPSAGLAIRPNERARRRPLR